MIEEAGFNIDATYDLLRRQLELRSISVRLPGIDLAGRASMSREADTGNWQAIQTLDVEGEVQPTRLAALLTGKAHLPAN